MPDIENRLPLLSRNVTQGGLADVAGGGVYRPEVESEAAGEIAFGGPTADFILYGVINGAFAQGPPDPTVNIEPVNNPLPYWFGPVIVQGMWTAKWIEDATYPSGYGLRLTQHSGVTDDEVYFEQIVPVGGTLTRVMGHAVRAGMELQQGNGDPRGKIALQYLDANGAAIGNATTAIATPSLGVYALATAFGHASENEAPPARAVYLRIRVGAVNLNTDSSGEILDVTDVRADSARLVTLLADAASPSTKAPGVILQSSGIIQIRPDGITSGTTTAANLRIGVNNSEFYGGLYLGSVISPSISTSQDNWAPTGIDTASVVFVTNTAGASRNITGINRAGTADGSILLLATMGSGGGGSDIVLVHNATSSAANRFSCPGSVDITISAGGGALLCYLSSRWRVLLRT